MDETMSGRVRLGELLVTAHIISRAQLDQALLVQKKDGRRLGKILVEQGFVTETQVTQILSQQLSVPWVSLHHIDFSRQLLDLVPEELADRHCLVPIFVRRVRGLGETLYIAMDDPTDDTAQRAVADFSGLPVRTMIAPPADIRAAIRAYYGSGMEAASLSEAVAELDAEEVAASRSSAPPRKRSSPPPEALPPPPVVPTAIEASPPPPVVVGSPRPPADSAPQIEAREVSMPAPARRKSRKMVTLTLLDGTRVNLPARSSPPAKGKSTAEGAPELTARDLVAALRAVSHGADAREILGDQVRWEPLFAALLELLLKKHLIADWEFVEEFRRV
jgi:type IV pilus assembly protein PilB